MSYSKMATMNWGSYLNNSDFLRLRNTVDPWISNAVADGKTDGISTKIDSLTFQRVWRDQEAVDEWAAFITDVAVNLGTSVTITVTDIY